MVRLPKEQEYFIIGTTGSNLKAIEKATEVELLQLGLDFRDRKISYEDLKERADEITQFAGSIVLPTFFVHIFSPEEFPILDVKVWRAYLLAQDKVISKHTKPRSWQHYDSYRQFFKETMNSTGLAWRTVDKGLWVIGDEVKVE